MNIKTSRIEDIKPYSGNPRSISDKAVKSVAESISKFGWQQPIVVDKDNVIIAGHTRFLAANYLRMKEVPTHVATDLTPTQVKAYRVFDNKLNDIADWDDDLLNSELKGLEDLEDFNMEEYGNFVDLFSIDDEGEDSHGSFLDELADGATDERGGVKIEALGKFVTISFVMKPDERDVVVSALREHQSSNDLANTTQSLIEILKSQK